MTAMTIEASALRRDIEILCARGPRNTGSPESMRAAAAFIETSFIQSGYDVERHSYAPETGGENVIAEVRGTLTGEILVVGAHYDSVYDSPGADDNASGVAALLALARHFAGARLKKTVRFVAFANEEPPHFQTPAMGSFAYARRCHDRGERIAGMLCLESLGYFDPAPGSQLYPPLMSLFYPDRGDFIGFAGNLASRRLVRRCVRTFRKHAQIAAQGAAVPELIRQIGWSDQWSFWQFGWPALMVTDTAPFRNPNYHRSSDTPETLDYERTARVVEGLIAGTGALTSSR
jgi:Zn-dependent M28 family amino/carboxypeptidase